MALTIFRAVNCVSSSLWRLINILIFKLFHVNTGGELRLYLIEYSLIRTDFWENTELLTYLNIQLPDGTCRLGQKGVRLISVEVDKI